ncbi:MAG: 8-amino-7-oxononanoate synthase [Holophagaceae bacterium]|nr:8-amino-7-oxononanoate synthase [Holophagaceae bacterium]
MSSAADPPKVPEGTADALPGGWRTRLEAVSRDLGARGLTRWIEPARGVDFCSNDYLGLRRDSRLAEASADAARNHGAGSGGARLLRGTSPLHEALEADLAAWKEQPACLLFNTGYQANSTLLPALARAGDAIFSDALNHASLVDGCRLAKGRGAHIGVYRHGDLEDLERQLAAWCARRPAGAQALVATDAVFSMDGDAADLQGLLALCTRREALLLVDEAHATGLLGPSGAGLAEGLGLAGKIPLLMGTLGKALGAFGAFVACPLLLREHLVNGARGFIFSTSLPPAPVGAALAAARIAREERWRAERALAHAARLRDRLGLAPQPSAIVPVLVGDEAKAMALASALQREGFDVRAVRPPTVPAGTARLRITTGAHQSEAQVDALLEALGRVL